MIRSDLPDIETLRSFSLGLPHSNWCQEPGWMHAFVAAYNLRSQCFTVKAEDQTVLGWMGALRVGNALLGNRWISLPYVDYGGPLAVSPEVEGQLVDAFLALASGNGLASEIRRLAPLAGRDKPQQEKTAMMLDLTVCNYEAWWKKLDAKVRNQVRKAEKSQVTLQWGARDQLDSFYDVFAVNMRDLGSPVHSKKFFEAVLQHVPQCEIGTAWREGRCIGGLFRLTWGDTLVIPWASTLREERVHCPNNALYHATIETAFARGLKKLDFGRSTKDEGTYKFKLQWLAAERELPWYPFAKDGKPISEVEHLGSGGMATIAKIWSRLPLACANFLGPLIRKDIAA